MIISNTCVEVVMGGEEVRGVNGHFKREKSVFGGREGLVGVGVCC